MTETIVEIEASIRARLKVRVPNAASEADAARRALDHDLAAGPWHEARGDGASPPKHLRVVRSWTQSAGANDLPEQRG